MTPIPDPNTMHATEVTSLLATDPSPHSTDSPVRRQYSSESIPLASSYEDLRETLERQIQEIEHSGPSKNGSGLTRQPFWKKQHAIVLLLACCFLSVLIMSIFSLQENEPHTISPLSGRQPFSTLHPVNDLGLAAFERPQETGPPRHRFLDRENNLQTGMKDPVPTNKWYQNLLMVNGEPSNLHRAYSMPYLVDMVGAIPGIRVHSNRILASSQVLQLTFNEDFGMTLGSAVDLSSHDHDSVQLSKEYRVKHMSDLGVTLQWDEMHMESTVVKGMPYTTMEYYERSTKSENGATLLPTVISPIGFGNDPVVDMHGKLKCSSKGSVTHVKSELKLHFLESDFTWMVFFSEPVDIRCVVTEENHSMLQVLDSNGACEGPLVIRVAVLDICSTGRNSMSCREGMGNRLPEEENVEEIEKVLRQSARFYPGNNITVSYSVEQGSQDAELVFDWDAKDMSAGCERQSTSDSLRKQDEDGKDAMIMFALPHHMENWNHSTPGLKTPLCKSSLIGPTCLVKGSSWTLLEKLPSIDFQAARPPKPQFLPALARSLHEDINYTLPAFFERGAGDTYFSGKMISKLARILLISEELENICDSQRRAFPSQEFGEYHLVCSNITLPTQKKRDAALGRLRSSVEVWINGTAETPFVYDTAWGGVVSCGCLFEGDGCKNQYPDCPAFSDQGLNFGNGFYNDQHFHYGYHIHGAAVVAHFDPSWGKKHFEQVLLLVRNIANPSRDDPFFPLVRHKDWYQGSSWASGVPRPPYLNGKNQESSSEAIAAYESVALYGKAMKDIWKSEDSDKASVSKEIETIGKLLAATELRATNTYWHIRQKSKHRLVPKEYTNGVVGILWSTMAQFGTWFGAAPYLPYGIQLLPLTPISEDRDQMDWVEEMYYPFSEACVADFQCTDSGWSVLRLAILATIGYAEEAATQLKEVPNDAFVNAGGNGHSKSNTLWYIATRPSVAKPIRMDRSDIRGHEELRPAPVFELVDCHTPMTCTSNILDRWAGEYTCRERIDWLIHGEGYSQWEACSQVGGMEFVAACGPCAPGLNPEWEKTNHSESSEDESDSAAASEDLQCPPCSEEECSSDLNRCPMSKHSFVCTGGPSTGGCSGAPWTLGKEQCASCCELTACQQLRDQESLKVTHDGTALQRHKCPPCPPSICYGTMNQCPLHTAPYLCLEGLSKGGCSSNPWAVASKEEDESTQCEDCCEVKVLC